MTRRPFHHDGGGPRACRPRCPCVACMCGRGPCAYGPPLIATDPAARRVAWALYAFACVFIAGLLAYACAGCTHRPPMPQIKAPPPAYGHRVVLERSPEE